MLSVPQLTYSVGCYSINYTSEITRLHFAGERLFFVTVYLGRTLQCAPRALTHQNRASQRSWIVPYRYDFLLFDFL